jgi:hypothetical protein
VLTIRTSSNAGHVWVHYDQTDVNALATGMDPSGRIIWTVTCYPLKSQQMEIYANADHSFSNAAVRLQGISVDRHDVRILSTEADRTTVNHGESVSLTVQTNNEATEVWAETDSGKVYLDYQYANHDGHKTWTSVFYPESTSTVWVYARKSGGREDSDSIRINVRTTENPTIYKVSVTPGFVVDGAGIEKNAFYVTTNKSVTSVYLEFNGQRYNAGSAPVGLGDEALWTVDAVPLEWPMKVAPLSIGINPGNDSFNITIFAVNRDGRSTSRNVAVTIKPGIKPL